MSKSRRVTASDVARRAGVSTATVSYVLNNTPGQIISTATQERVLEAAKHLSYVRNPAARTLARGGSRFIILDMSIFPRGEVANDAIEGFLKAIDATGYTPLLTWWGADGGEKRLMRLVQEVSPIGVITAAPISELSKGRLAASGVGSVSSLVASVEELFTPLRRGTEAQVKHLVENGHQHLLYVPEADPALTQLSHWREEAGGAMARRLGATWTTVNPSEDVSQYQDNLQRALDSHPEASAIAAYNDHVAVFALASLHRLGKKVPDDIAVMGVDNLPFTAATYPPLTTVRFHYKQDEFNPELIRALFEGEGQLGLLGSMDDLVEAVPVPRESA